MIADSGRTCDGGCAARQCRSKHVFLESSPRRITRLTKSGQRAEEALDKEQTAKRFWTSHQATITGPHNYAEQTHPISSSPQRHQQQQQSSPKPRRSIPSTEKEWSRTEDQKIRDGIQADLAGQDIYMIRFLGHIPTRTEAQVLRRYNLLKQTVRNDSHVAVPGNQTSQSSMTTQNTLNAEIPLQTFQPIPHSIQEVQQELVEAVTVLAEENAKPQAQAQVQQQTHLQASMQIMQNQQGAQRMQNSIQHLRPSQHLDQPFQGQIMPNHLRQFQKKTLQQLHQLQPFRARAHAQAQAQAQSQASLQQEASQQQGMNMMQFQQAAQRMTPQTRAEQATQNVQASPRQNVQPSEFIEEVEAEEEESEGIKFVEGNNIYNQVLKFQRRNAQNPCKWIILGFKVVC